MKKTYQVRVDARVVRELSHVPAADAKRLFAAIESLAKNPRPRGARKLVDQPGWRVRVGAYRILYEVEDDSSAVTVFRAGHRREIYR